MTWKQVSVSDSEVHVYVISIGLANGHRNRFLCRTQKSVSAQSKLVKAPLKFGPKLLLAKIVSPIRTQISVSWTKTIESLLKDYYQRLL
jgi:hypothetical protein